ncbi:MAG: hypothetical protein AABZ77_03505, partial [Chloroflexota bacterium]
MKGKILSLITALVLIGSLFAVVKAVTPASAGTLEWTTESFPSALVGYGITTTSIVDYAVASDNGTTIYMVAGTPHLYKSTNGGTSWSRL